MKHYRVHIMIMAILLFLISGLVFAQDGPVEPAAALTYEYNRDRLQYEGQVATPEPAVTELVPDMEFALVPCGDGVTGPCDLIATKAEDIVGVWAQYLIFPLDNTRGSMAYIRYNADGTAVMADSIGNTAQPMEGFPSSTFHFDGTRLIFDAIPTHPAPCNGEGIFQVRVLKYGDVPVALRYVPISDACTFRLQDLSQAAVWVAPGE